MVADQWQKGASLIFSSAATLAAGTYTLPVYEIYKVGTPLHWVSGLKILESILPNTAIVGHWNNTDGGDELDTSHCYIGESRFLQLLELVSADTAIFGIDEHTGVVIDPEKQLFMPLGLGAAYRVLGDQRMMFDAGKAYSLTTFAQIDDLDQNTFFSSFVYRGATEQKTQTHKPSFQIQKLVEVRAEARQQKNFALADEIRQQLYQFGYEVEDGQSGSTVLPVSENK